MSIPQTFPSGWSTRKNSTDRTYVEPPESIGTPFDAPATDVNAENSAFALLKGIASLLGVPTGSGAADINDNGKVYPDPLATLGDRTDAAATVAADPNSAIAMLKGIAGELGL